MQRTLRVTGMLCPVAPMVSLGILAYRWSRRRATTAWPMMSATATMFFH